jgi:hypothetical protein
MGMLPVHHEAWSFWLEVSVSGTPHMTTNCEVFTAVNVKIVVISGVML